ncbi:glycosyltransferase [Thiohalocapsa marina]|nr:glycosyltransferase [Thiohalocapsa marina]
MAVFASFSGNGGVERMLVNLMQGFVDLGHPVDLLLADDRSQHLSRLPAAVRCIRTGSRHTQLAAFGLARYLRRHRPPVLLVAKDRAGRAAVLARRLAGTDTRIVLRLGTNLSTAMAERSAVNRWLRYAPIRRLYPSIERIVAVSDGVAADTRAIAYYPHERIRVIRNPVITPDMQQRALQAVPHPWLNPAQRAQCPVVLGAGRLERQKDFSTLIQAFARVRRQRPCRLILIGEGGWRERLTQQIAALEIEADVDLPGHQSNPYPFLANADLFVLSSAWEGSPNVLTEAMALGTPVVSTDCPSGPRETLAGGRFGPLVPVGDADALSEAMAQTLDHPLPPPVLKDAVSDYHYLKSAARYLELLDEIEG